MEGWPAGVAISKVPKTGTRGMPNIVSAKINGGYYDVQLIQPRVYGYVANKNTQQGFAVPLYQTNIYGIELENNNDYKKRGQDDLTLCYLSPNSDSNAKANYPTFSMYDTRKHHGYWIMTASEMANYKGSTDAGAVSDEVDTKVGIPVSAPTTPAIVTPPSEDKTPPVYHEAIQTGTGSGYISRFPEFSNLLAGIDFSGWPVPKTTTGGNPPGNSTTGSSGGKPNSASAPNTFTPAKSQTKVVVRMPLGYSAPTTVTGIEKPALVQFYTEKDADGKDSPQNESFVFDYIPNNVRYSDLGSEWQEIPRALNYAFVDWNKYKLMKISLSFLIAEQRQDSSTTVGDGIYNSVDEKITKLRRMASRKNPISVLNMDDLLSIQLKRSDTQSRGMEFVIQDLSITANRRTVDAVTGKPTVPSHIAAAQVEMTLQEIPVESVTLIKLPNLTFTKPIIPKKGNGVDIGSVGLVTDYFSAVQPMISDTPAVGNP